MIVFFKCSSEMDSLALLWRKFPRYAMNPTRKPPETCSRMALNFLSFNFSGIFCISQQNIPQISQFSTSAILKYANWVWTLQRLPATHTCLQWKVSNVKLLLCCWARQINGISWICIRAKCKCRVKPKRNASGNVYKIYCDSSLDLLLWCTCLARHEIVLCLFRTNIKLYFVLFLSDPWWERWPYVGGVSYQNSTLFSVLRW